MGHNGHFLSLSSIWRSPLVGLLGRFLVQVLERRGLSFQARESEGSPFPPFLLMAFLPALVFLWFSWYPHPALLALGKGDAEAGFSPTPLFNLIQKENNTQELLYEILVV